MSVARVTVGPGDDPAALVRTAAKTAGSVLLLLDPALDPLAAALARAAVGPLAVELAPEVRVNALAPGAHADPADIEAAAEFLEGARSTTGQVLQVSPRG